MSTKKTDGNYAADMEAGYNIGVFAASPRMIARSQQRKRMSAIREAIRDAMLALGYETQRAEDTAEKLANHLPAIEAELPKP